MRFEQPLAVLALLTTVNTYSIPTDSQHSQQLSLRYPPPSVRARPTGGYKGHRFDHWIPPPSPYLHGTYHITHASQPTWVQSFVNLQLDFLPPYPEDGEPSSSTAVVQSWSDCVDPGDLNCKDPNAVDTLFGYDRAIPPRGPTDRRYTAAWNFTAAGALEGVVGNLSAVLAWGFDYKSRGWMVRYSTDAHDSYGNKGRRGGSIQILSRTDKGMNNSTLHDTLQGLRKLGQDLGDEDFASISLQVKALVHDGRRCG